MTPSHLGPDNVKGILLGVNTYDSRGLRIKAYKRVQPFLEISLPNGGESYALGSTQTIHWNGSSLSGTVNLELLVNGEVAGTIAENLPSSPASCEWEVGKLSTGAWIDPGSDFKIRVTALGVPNRFETVYSIYGSDGKLLSEYNETGTCTKDYLYLGGKLLAEFQPLANKYYYYTSDQINSTRIVTDSTGSLAYSRQYDPFGGILSTESKVFVPNPGFSGKERESVSELDYFGARYYDHRTFRFNALDPISNSTGATKSPQLWNLYIYCRNNPITFLDPNGEDSILGIHTNAPPGSKPGYGHAWISVLDLETMKKTTYGLWPDNHYYIASFVEQDPGPGSDVRTNIEIEHKRHGEGYRSKYSRFYYLNEEQERRLAEFVKLNKQFDIYKYNCTNFATELIENITGDKLNATESFMIGKAQTPRQLAKEIIRRNKIDNRSTWKKDMD